MKPLNAKEDSVSGFTVSHRVCDACIPSYLSRICPEKGCSANFYRLMINGFTKIENRLSALSFSCFLAPKCNQILTYDDFLSHTHENLEKCMKKPKTDVKKEKPVHSRTENHLSTKDRCEIDEMKLPQNTKEESIAESLIKIVEQIRTTETNYHSLKAIEENQKQSLRKLTDQCKTYETEKRKMNAEIDKLKREISELQANNGKLNEENEKLKEKNEQLTTKQNENTDMNEMFEKFTVEWMERKGLSATCKICQEIYDTNLHFQTALKCGHTFGENCIRATLQNSDRCPVCNRKANINEMSRVYS